MQFTKLQADVIIGGTRYAAGQEIIATDEAIRNGINRAVKEDIRSQIEQNAGDDASLLGTTSDATQLLLYGFCQLVAALHKADSLADVRKAAKPFAGLAAGFLGKVESGEVKLPFQAKGLEKVVGEIEHRATAVTEVLAQVSSNNAHQEA